MGSLHTSSVIIMLLSFVDVDKLLSCNS